MDPISLTASVLTILQVVGASRNGINKLLSLKDAPQQLQQLSNEAEALRALLLETDHILQLRCGSKGYDRIEAKVVPVLHTVKAHVLEFEQLIHLRLSKDISTGNILPKVNRSYWLRAAPEIQRVKQNIKDSRDILKGQLALLGLDDCYETRANMLQIQRISLTNQVDIQEIKDRQQDLHYGVHQLGKRTQQSLEQTHMYIKQSETDLQNTLLQMRGEQRQDFAAIQACITTSIQPLRVQMEQLALGSNPKLLHSGGDSGFEQSMTRSGSTVQVFATLSSQRCPQSCRCQCHIKSTGRSPHWLKGVVGQLMWNYNSSISMRNCSLASCRRGASKHHLTYRFPSWLLSRALVASVNLETLSGSGAKISISMPIIVPEEGHIVWSLVIAGNVEQLRELLSKDGNLMYARNQWGQTIMHVAAKVHQPTVFNLLLSLGMDPHTTDENYKSPATTVMTRRGSEEYALSVDIEDLSDRLSWTDLHCAAALKREDRRITEDLLRAGFDDLNSRDALGRAPLHWLAENGEADAIRHVTQDPWRADVHMRDNAGFTPLHCACWADDLESAAVLLQAGSDPNARDKHQRTPLMHFDDNRLLELTLWYGANVHIRDDEGCNIMHHVCVSDQSELAQTLLERYGHELFVQNHKGDTPFTEALLNNSTEVLTVMLPYLAEFPVEKIGMRNKNKRNALHLAALHASTEAMDILASVVLCGLDADVKDNDGHTPNECFMKCRDAHCAVTRKSVELEKRSWVRLMKSVRGESDLLFEVAVSEEKLNKETPSADPLFAGSTVFGSDSDSEDYFDAAEDSLSGAI